MNSSISELGRIHSCKLGFQSKINKRMANSADSDETAGYKPSYLDLHCLLGYLYWYVGMKELREMDTLMSNFFHYFKYYIMTSIYCYVPVINSWLPFCYDLIQNNNCTSFNVLTMPKAIGQFNRQKNDDIFSYFSQKISFDILCKFSS